MKAPIMTERDEIARIIDPDAWALFDKVVVDSKTERQVAESRAKADAILAKQAEVRDEGEADLRAMFIEGVTWALAGKPGRFEDAVKIALDTQALATPKQATPAVEALKHYRDQLCEGFCEDFTLSICVNTLDGDCGGCRAVVALAALTPADAGSGGEDIQEYKDVLHDLVALHSEEYALNGGGPGIKGRWEKAWSIAEELVRVEP